MEIPRSPSYSGGLNLNVILLHISCHSLVVLSSPSSLPEPRIRIIRTIEDLSLFYSYHVFDVLSQCSQVAEEVKALTI